MLSFRNAYPPLLGRSVLLVGALLSACADPPTRAVAGPATRVVVDPCTEPGNTACSPPPTTAFDGDRFGVVTFTTMGDDQTFADLTTATGAGWVRIPVSWAVLQHDNQTAWNQGGLDQLRRAITRAQAGGMQVMLTLQDTPPWARQCWPSGPDDYWGYTVNDDPSSPRCLVDSKGPPHPAMYAWYRQFVADMVRMYPEVKAWGIWNEPNVIAGSPTPSSAVRPDSGFFHPWPNTGSADLRTRAAEQYTLLVGYAADAIHAVPGKLLLAPDVAGAVIKIPECGTMDEPSHMRNGTIDSRTFLADILARGGNSIDVVTVHDYSTPGTSRSSRDTNGCGTMFNTLSQYADLLRGRWPMWLTEFGYDVDSPGVTGRFTEAQRVTWINQVVANMRSNSIGEWKKSFVYTLGTPHFFQNDDNHALVLGFPTGNPQPTPSYYCFQSLASGARSC